MVAKPDPGQIKHPLDVVQQAVVIGGVSAIPGTIVGAYAGTIRTSTPILFSLVSGLQWFSIGTTFWAVRSSILNQTGLLNWWNLTRGAPLHTVSQEPPSRSDKVRASAISGGITGAVLGAVFRGPRNVIPGTIMFTLFGYTGQHGYEWLDRRNTETVIEEAEVKAGGKPKPNWLQRVAKSQWSPMEILTDEQYEKLMNERILRVEADIALIDERIEQNRKLLQEEERASKTGSSSELGKK